MNFSKEISVLFFVSGRIKRRKKVFIFKKIRRRALNLLLNIKLGTLQR